MGGPFEEVLYTQLGVGGEDTAYAGMWMVPKRGRCPSKTLVNYFGSLAREGLIMCKRTIEINERNLIYFSKFSQCL